MDELKNPGAELVRQLSKVNPSSIIRVPLSGPWGGPEKAEGRKAAPPSEEPVDEKDLK